MQKRSGPVGGAVIFFLVLCRSVAFADDHSWLRGGRGHSAQPLDGIELGVLSVVSAGAFAACFAGLLFLHVWLAGVVLRLGWVFALLAPLCWPLFWVGAGIPVGIWMLAVFIEQGLAGLPQGELFFLLTLGFLSSLLYHYLLFMVLGLFSPRGWGRISVWLQGIVLCAAVILTFAKGSLIILLLCLALCLIPCWIAQRVHSWRTRRIRARSMAVTGNVQEGG